MEDPKVSIIVPIYNVELYLPRCIDSVLAQTFTDFELILVDDGSPDRCGLICDEYAEKDNRIRVIHQENQKASAARNAGLKIARGEWIAFIDPDDWIHKGYLQILLSGTQEDTDFVICDFIITSNDIENDEDLSEVVFTDASLTDISKNHYIATRPCWRIIRRSTIGDLRFITGTEPTEDSCFNELLFRDDMKFRVTAAKLYYYYMRPDSAIHTHMGRGAFNSIIPLLQRLQRIEDPEKRKRIISRCYKYVFSARYGERYADDYAMVKRQCKELFGKLSGYLHELDRKDRIVYGAFVKSPSLYRLWRISDDPTLLTYEKNQREIRRTQKKSNV